MPEASILRRHRKRHFSGLKILAALFEGVDRGKVGGGVDIVFMDGRRFVARAAAGH